MMFEMKVLPQELLSKIFIASMAPPEEIESTLRDPTCAPLLLCQITSSWRTTAIRTPQLWQRMVIFLRYRIRKDFEGGWLGYNWEDCTKRSEIQLIDLWASRRGALPALMSFQSSRTSVLVDVDYEMTSFGDILKSHLDVVCSAQSLALCDAAPNNIALLVEALVRHEFQNLQHLTISISRTNELPNNVGPRGLPWPPSAKGASHLKRLYIDTAARILEPTKEVRIQQALSFGSLTHVAINGLKTTRSEWWSILHQCTSLTHLAVSLDLTDLSSNEATRYKHPVVSQDTLREIILELAFPHISAIFEGIIFPSVTKFRISFGTRPSRYYSDLPSIHNLLRSTPNVRELYTQYWFPVVDNNMLVNFLDGRLRHELGSEERRPRSCPPLSEITPHLQTISVYGIRHTTYRLPVAWLSELELILNSTWLLEGWPTPITKSIIFAIDSTFFGMDPQALQLGLRDRSKPDNTFVPTVTSVDLNHWKWESMSGIDLACGWNQWSSWLITKQGPNPTLKEEAM